ncbi:radical SAM protein [uncultured Roseovarius sp.]|uniref:B12-binding domain-containing radical SAM protein n=1 Tax=uncultured Roseovarius sp. TaxID=293344 RepID=UPI0026290AE3|nr:radical SAM protein [uncultured Roseovarius sp.]
MKIHARKPRVLVVIAHFDEMRRHQGRPNFFPQGVGHAYLAGAFHPEKVDIRLYSEVHSGPLEDLDLLAWPDMVVLTGVTAALDRMRHITAYIRVLAPQAIVVVGGPVARNLPTLCAEIFDVVCKGDIEELQTIASDHFGPDCAAEEMFPRFDLLVWKGPVNYVETSRYCNFKCSFCALTGEGHRFKPYATDYIEAQIRSQPAGRYVLFIDNNFYGSSRGNYAAKLDLIRKLWHEGLFKGWIALVTNDFFAREQNVLDAKSAGCVGLFSGVESLDSDQLAKYGKRQNLAVPQLSAIEMCLKAGIVYQYGLMFDPATESVSKMMGQLDFIIEYDRIPMPAFMSLTIPLLGTPEFYRCLDEGMLLPNARLRDMDGVTMVSRPLDPMPEVVEFIRNINSLGWARRRIFKRYMRFFKRYRGDLSAAQMSTLLFSGLRVIVPGFEQNNVTLFPGAKRSETLTHSTLTQPLGRLYDPIIPMPEHLLGHFEPTIVTDSNGALNKGLVDLIRHPKEAPKERALAQMAPKV